MIAPPAPLRPPLDRLSSVAARSFADPNEAIAAILGLARDLLGLSTALVVRAEGETWRAVHVDDATFGFAPGDTLPLEDTF